VTNGNESLFELMYSY